jgi:protein-L-isoaspartate(D-aspartate) O-methyltransferase
VFPRGRAGRDWVAAGLVLMVGAAGVEAMSDMPGREDGAPERAARQAMVEQQLRARGILNPEVLKAMGEVPRHLFVAPSERAQAYEDHPLPIGYGQTISQPYIVALMTALAQVHAGQRVLEIGTGSGYQAAVLAQLGTRVDSIEIIPALAARARKTLAALGFAAVHVRTGDGFRGWPEEAPFDAIVLTAAPRGVPDPLVAQLKTGGKMVVPVGDEEQTLLVLTKRRDGSYDETPVLPVRFVPMTGEAQRPPR